MGGLWWDEEDADYALPGRTEHRAGKDLGGGCRSMGDRADPDPISRIGAIRLIGYSPSGTAKRPSSSGYVEPFHRLTCEFGDEVEVLVKVQNG